MGKVKIRTVTTCEIRPDEASFAVSIFQRYAGSHVMLVIDELDQHFHATEPSINRGVYSEYMKVHREIESHEEEVDLEEFLAWFKTVEGIPYYRRQAWGYVWKALRYIVRNGRKAAQCHEFAGWYRRDVKKDERFEDPEFHTPEIHMNILKGRA